MPVAVLVVVVVLTRVVGTTAAVASQGNGKIRLKSNHVISLSTGAQSTAPLPVNNKEYSGTTLPPTWANATTSPESPWPCTKECQDLVDESTCHAFLESGFCLPTSEFYRYMLNHCILTCGSCRECKGSKIEIETELSKIRDLNCSTTAAVFEWCFADDQVKLIGELEMLVSIVRIATARQLAAMPSCASVQSAESNGCITLFYDDAIVPMVCREAIGLYDHNKLISLRTVSNIILNGTVTMDSRCDEWIRDTIHNAPTPHISTAPSKFKDQVLPALNAQEHHTHRAANATVILLWCVGGTVVLAAVTTVYKLGKVKKHGRGSVQLTRFSSDLVKEDPASPTDSLPSIPKREIAKRRGFADWHNNFAGKNGPKRAFMAPPPRAVSSMAEYPTKPKLALRCTSSDGEESDAWINTDQKSMETKKLRLRDSEANKSIRESNLFKKNTSSPGPSVPPGGALDHWSQVGQRRTPSLKLCPRTTGEDEKDVQTSM